MYSNNVPCIEVLGKQDICHFTSNVNRILSFLLPVIWDILFNILVSFRDIEYLGKLIMGVFDSL